MILALRSAIGQFSPKEAPKIRQMRDIAGSAVKPLALLVHRRNRNDATVFPASKLPGEFQPNREVLEPRSQAEPTERTHHVRRHDDSSADLMKRLCLFIDRRLMSRPL